jgi:hypothetical protein
VAPYSLHDTVVPFERLRIDPPRVHNTLTAALSPHHVLDVHRLSQRPVGKPTGYLPARPSAQCVRSRRHALGDGEDRTDHHATVEYNRDTGTLHFESVQRAIQCVHQPVTAGRAHTASALGFEWDEPGPRGGQLGTILLVGEAHEPEGALRELQTEGVGSIRHYFLRRSSQLAVPFSMRP